MKSRIVTTVLLAILSFKTVIAQNVNFEWAKQIKATGNSIAVDGSRNVYAYGSFQGTVDFDPGSGVFNLTATSSSNIFICKLDAAGGFVWAKQFDGMFNEFGDFLMAVDSPGNVFFTGFFTDTGDFDPGPGTHNLISHGFRDIFIGKLNVAGNLVWVKQIGGLSDDESNSIAIDKYDNVYNTGGFSSTVDFDPGPDTFNLTCGSHRDIFVTKLDSSGNLVWAKKMREVSSSTGSGVSIAVDAKGDIYSTGAWVGTVDFDPDTGTFSIVGSYDSYISKLDSGGRFVWAKKIENATYTLFVDLHSNVYTTGLFYGTVDFDPNVGIYNLTSVAGGNGSIFINKLDEGGNFVWAKKMGGNPEITDVGYSVAVDAGGSVYSTGIFADSSDFNPGAGVFMLSSAGYTDMFISKLDSSGNFVWAKPIGGKFSEFSLSIDVDGLGNIYTTGQFQDIVDFDPSPGVFNLGQPLGGGAFILKLSQGGSVSVEDIKSEDGLVVYPNPASNYLTVIMPVDFGETKIKVFDVLGETELSSVISKQQSTIDVSTLTKGIHILEIASGNSITRKKFVKD